MFGNDSEFFKYNVREKLALIIIFILGVMVLIIGTESETVKYIIVGLFAFLKGGVSQEQINNSIEKQLDLTKEKEKLEKGGDM